MDTIACAVIKGRSFRKALICSTSGILSNEMNISEACLSSSSDYWRQKLVDINVLEVGSSVASA